MLWKLSFMVDGKTEEFSFEGNKDTTCTEIIKAFVSLHKEAKEIKVIGFISNEKLKKGE